MADTKWSQFPSATPGNSDEVVGLHSGDNARFSIANIVAAVRNGLASIFVPLTRTINSKALSTDISLDSSDIDYDNTQSGLSATDVQEAIDELAQGGGGGSAADITYDPTTSRASATNVQDALDEAFGDLDDKQDEIIASGILKGDGAGGVTAATPGTDYATPAQLADKANQAQLAYVETGTTASQNYTAGQYISLNGLLYTADTAIASGSTFYTSGGNKNLTKCVGGGLNSNSIQWAAIPLYNATAHFTLNRGFGIAKFYGGNNGTTAVLTRTEQGSSKSRTISVGASSWENIPVVAGDTITYYGGPYSNGFIYYIGHHIGT